MVITNHLTMRFTTNRSTILSSSSVDHRYEITTTSNTSLQVHINAAQILKDDDPFYLGGGGQVTNKPAEVEITTSGENGNTVIYF